MGEGGRGGEDGSREGTLFLCVQRQGRREGAGALKCMCGRGREGWWRR